MSYKDRKREAIIHECTQGKYHVHVYTRMTDKFVSQSDGSPSWATVVRRTTADAETGETLEDSIAEYLPLKKRDRLLPGPLRLRNTTTSLYFIKEGGVPAVTSLRHPELNPRRRLIEFCCSESSKLGDSRFNDGEQCARVRLTIEHDLTTNEGFAFALKEAYLADQNTLLWGALPCTAGCTWGRINIKKPGGPAKMKEHLRVFNQLMAHFVIIARIVTDRGGKIAFEWPAGCTLWSLDIVQKMVTDFKLKLVNFDGCQLDLVSKNGNPILKPWTIATSCDTICLQRQYLPS